MFLFGRLWTVPLFHTIWQSAVARCLGFWRRILGLLGSAGRGSLGGEGVTPNGRKKSLPPPPSPPPPPPPPPASPPQLPKDVVFKGELLGFGTTALTEKLPSGHVVKSPIPSAENPGQAEDRRSDMRTEAEIYRRLGDSPYAPRLVAWDPASCCLTLEYMENGSLEMYVQGKHSLGDFSRRTRPPDISASTRRRWTLQAAAALRALHDVGAVHCDFGPRNLLLDGRLNLHISDFAGSSLDGSAASVACGPRFQPPGWSFDRPARRADDLFALGSVLYFIMTGHEPYADRPDADVEPLFARRCFPDDLDRLVCAPAVRGCWEGSLHSADSVLDLLTALYEDGDPY